MKTFHQLLDTHLHQQKDKVLFTIKRGLRREVWTGDHIIQTRSSFAQYLHSQGYKPGDRYMIWGPNCPEWAITLLAGIENNYVAVPADARSSWPTIEAYIKKTQPAFVVVSNLLLPFFKGKMPAYVLEDIAALQKKSTHAPSQHLEDIEIVFTSGSSGNPKGVVLTQNNLMAQLEQTEKMLPPLSRFETVSILPLSHAYEQIYGLFLPIIAHGTIHYLGRFNLFTLKRELKRSRATYLLSVPQMLRLMYDEVLQQVEQQGKTTVFQYMLQIAQHLPMHVRKILFSSVHQTFGGCIQFMTSGSAPLEPKLAKIWEAMGFQIIEGYGATETTGMATALPWQNRKFGTVGLPASQTQIQLGSEGEILIKGPIVSKGYFRDEPLTKQSFVDGWYKTGDIGEIDADGFLRITGRMSTRIILSDGTKVYPEDIERMLNDQPEIKDSCVTEVKQRDDTKIHAWVVFQGGKKHQLETIMTRVNVMLESKQQIFSYNVWPQTDFPRLRSRKVNRNVVKVLTQSQQHTSESNQEKNIVIENMKADLHTILTSLSGKKQINIKDTLGGELQLDSLRRIQLAAMIEQYLGKQINEFYLTAQTTVKELHAMLESDHMDTGERHGWEEIIHHWRFSPIISLARNLVLRFVVFPLHRLFVRLQLVDPDHVLKTLKGPVLIIFNHPGMYDLLCTMRVLPNTLLKKLAVAATEERWEDGNTTIANIIDFTICGYPIGRKGPWMTAGLEATGELVDRGYSILFAPEGEMQREGTQQPFLPGLGYLAKELHVPVIMCKLNTKEYREIFPAPRPNDKATDSRYFWPRKIGRIILKIKKAAINASLNSDLLTTSIEKQFTAL